MNRCLCLFELLFSESPPSSVITGSHNTHPHSSQNGHHQKKSTNNKCGRGCRGKATPLHCWECKLIQPPWRTIWGGLKKLKIEVPYVLLFFLSLICWIWCLDFFTSKLVFSLLSFLSFTDYLWWMSGPQGIVMKGLHCGLNRTWAGLTSGCHNPASFLGLSFSWELHSNAEVLARKATIPLNNSTQFSWMANLRIRGSLSYLSPVI